MPPPAESKPPGSNASEGREGESECQLEPKEEEPGLEGEPAPAPMGSSSDQEAAAPVESQPDFAGSQASEAD
eukprot:7844910-Alexandrium_andersonii.AAC.1